MSARTLQPETSRRDAADSQEEVLRVRAQILARPVEEETTEETVSILVFRLREEWYGVDVTSVREIYRDYEVTPLPCVPEYILGVVNMRGEILSVVDLSLLMHAEASGVRGPAQPAVVLENAESVTAVVVDALGEIVDVPVDSIEPPVSVVDRYHAEFAAGSVVLGDTLVGLLNVDRVLAPIGEGPRY